MVGAIQFIGIRTSTSTESNSAAELFRKRGGALEPVAAVGYPPTKKENRDSCAQRPPERQNEISYQPQDRENDPKDFSFHYPSL
jgi:hypothetical protein